MLLHRGRLVLAGALILSACSERSAGTPTAAGTGGASAASAAASTGATGTGAGGTGGSAPPTFAAECASNGGTWDLVQKPGASIQFGGMAPAADDGAVCELVLPGDPALGPADHVGPGFATEIDSVMPFSFGTYRTRVSLASCAA